LWDTKRPDAAAASLGYFTKLLQEMPSQQLHRGDSLNTSISGILGAKGMRLIADAIVSSAAFQNRKRSISRSSNFGSHRIAGNWTHQYDNSTDPAAQWPNGLSGLSIRRPHTVTVNVTSTLSPSLLNEGRFGLNLNQATATNPWNLSDSSIRDRARSFMLQGGASLSGMGTSIPCWSRVYWSWWYELYDNGLMFTSGATEASFSNPLYNFADTPSWSHESTPSSWRRFPFPLI
jgi:hypothetical protein